jgi:hypothetical protein
MMVATKVGLNYFFPFQCVLNIVTSIYYKFCFFYLCINLWPMTTLPNKWGICIVNSKLWCFGIWILGRYVICPRFWITRIVTYKIHRFIKKNITHALQIWNPFESPLFVLKRLLYHMKQSNVFFLNYVCGPILTSYFTTLHYRDYYYLTF